MAESTSGVDREGSTTKVDERLIRVRISVTWRIDRGQYPKGLLEADRRTEALFAALREIDPRASYSWSFIEDVSPGAAP
jgi:hypothetical protein